MFRSFQIIIREFRHSLLKLLHIHDLVRFCKQGVVSAYHVLQESVVENAVGQVCVLCYQHTTHTLYNRFLHNMIFCKFSSCMLSTNLLNILVYLLIRVSLLTGQFSVRNISAFSLSLSRFTRSQSYNIWYIVYKRTCKRDVNLCIS